MASYEFQRVQIPAEELGGTLGAILVIDAVKSVPANALREPFERTGVDGGRFRQSAVKTSVEDGDLENGAKAILDDFDAFQFGAIVERRESGHARYCGLYVRREGGCLFKVYSTMHDTMTYYVDF